MATINLGAIKFNWRGAYAGGTAYAVDDVVSSGGSSYVCILASTGNATSNGTYWEQMSSAGTNGTDGTDVGTTITTQGDILYRDGSGLQRLGAGTSGQALITGGTGANPSWGTVSDNFSTQLFHATSNYMNHTGGAWRTVTLDTVATNEITGASLSSNQITLPIGTYFIQSNVPFYRVNGFATKLYNVTGSANLVLGSQGHSWEAPSDATSPQSILAGKFTIAGSSKAVELQYQCDSDNGQSNTSYTSVSNQVLIWKTA